MALQKQLRGLQDLLGLFEGGNVIAESGGVVTPTLNIMQCVQPPEWIEGEDTFSNINDSASLKVEQNFRYLLHHVGWGTLSFVNNNTTRFKLTPNITTLAGSVLGLNQLTAAANFVVDPGGASYYGGINFPDPLLLEAGTLMNLTLTDKAGTGGTIIRYGWQVTKIRV